MSNCFVFFFFFFSLKKKQIKRSKPTSPYFPVIYTTNPSHFAKMTLLRNRHQIRRELSSSTGATTAGGRSFTSLEFLNRENHRRHRSPVVATFLSAATFHQRRVSLDSQCGHFLGLKRLLQPTQRQRKIKLSELKLLVVANGQQGIVEIHLVGVAYKARRILLKNIRNLNRIRKFLQASVVKDQLSGGNGGRFRRTANTH